MPAAAAASESDSGLRMGIDYVTDTLGRTIDFYYESNLLRKVREARSGGTYFDYVTLSYAPITIATYFSSPTITATDPSLLSGKVVWQQACGFHAV